MPPTPAASSESRASPAQEPASPHRLLHLQQTNLQQNPPVPGDCSCSPGMPLTHCHADAKPSLSPLPIRSTTSSIVTPKAGQRLHARRRTLGEQSILPRGTGFKWWLPAGHIPPCSEPAQPHWGRSCQHGCGSGLDAHKHFPLGARVWWDGHCSGGWRWPVPSPGLFSQGGCACVCMCVHQANVLLAVTITSL